MDAQAAKCHRARGKRIKAAGRTGGNLACAPTIAVAGEDCRCIESLGRALHVFELRIGSCPRPPSPGAGRPQRRPRLVREAKVGVLRPRT